MITDEEKNALEAAAVECERTIVAFGLNPAGYSMLGKRAVSALSKARDHLRWVAKKLATPDYDDEPPCECGHVLDEHDPACTVETAGDGPCPCIHYEASETGSVAEKP